MSMGDSPPYLEKDVQHAQVGIGEVERLYLEQGGRLWAAVFAYARDPGVADDAVAEAFAQLLRRGGEVRDQAAWVWTATFRLAAGELQRQRSIVHRVPDRSYEPQLADGRVTAAVSKLPDRQRAAVLLHYYADRPVKEAARIMGTSPAAVGVHLFRARKRLAELLGDDL
jgi:RNA polymerase sigma-70 factor (ECF subfamily)